MVWRVLVTAVLCGWAATLSLPAMSMMETEQAASLVQRMEAQGQPASLILSRLLSDGRSLDDAAALSISHALSGDTQAALTHAALCSPGAGPATEQVSLDAAQHVAAVKTAIDQFDPRSCSPAQLQQPPVLTGGVPGRGGVSGGAGGGGVVSPAS